MDRLEALSQQLATEYKARGGPKDTPEPAATPLDRDR
jgi:hypothetical protein